jgi:hypothetical protein
MASSARAAAVALGAAAGVPLTAYVWALHPGLAGGDSSELVTAVATGGVAHPPGYPLYVMAGWLWLKLWPHASPAWAMNLFSALCMAAAAAVLAAAVRRASGSWTAGVLAAWLFAASPPVFANALVAEVFGLHALLAACALLAMVSSPAAGAVALAFLGTLALSHHHALLLLVAPGFVACASRALRGPPEARGSSPGSSPRRSSDYCRCSGSRARPGTRRRSSGASPGHLGIRLAAARRRSRHARARPARGGHETSLAQLVAFARALPAELSWVGLALAALGAWRLWGTRREVAIALPRRRG